MKISDIVRKHKNIDIALNSDSDEILKLFEKMRMKTSESFSLFYDRSPDFFSFLSLQSSDYKVMVLRDNDQKIIGVASIVRRDAYVEGEKIKLGYLSDLRIDIPSDKKEALKALVTWKNCFDDVMNNIKTLEDFHCDYLITAIMKGNEKAKNSLVRQEKGAFRYTLYSNYKMVSIIDFLGTSRISKYKVKRATLEEKKEVLEFFSTHQKQRNFGYTKEQLIYQLENWTNFSIENFFLVKKNDELVGIVSTWNPSLSKSIVVDKAPFFIKFMNSLMSLFTKTPKVNEKLKIEYLNHFTWNREAGVSTKEMIRDVLYALRKEQTFKKFDFVSFIDFPELNLSKSVRYAIKDITDLELYEVHLKEKKPLRNDLLPMLELSLV